MIFGSARDNEAAMNDATLPWLFGGKGVEAASSDRLLAGAGVGTVGATGLAEAVGAAGRASSDPIGASARFARALAKMADGSGFDWDLFAIAGFDCGLFTIGGFDCDLFTIGALTTALPAVPFKGGRVGIPFDTTLAWGCNCFAVGPVPHFAVSPPDLPLGFVTFGSTADTFATRP